MTEIFLIAVPAFVVGAGVGLMAYRYFLKRDPVKLEKWAAEAKELGKRVRS